MVDTILPDFIFLSETQTFQHEAKFATDLFEGTYCSFLNSDDLYDQELPFVRNRSNGGTMILWKESLDKYVSIPPVVSSSFLSLIFQPPSSPPSLHIALYLPTSGKEAEFIEEISKLRNFLENILDENPDYIIFIRGDSNVNIKNKPRLNIFKDFIRRFKLINIDIGHKTYHHFLGDGLFDSAIDVILCNDHENLEQVNYVYCKHNYQFIGSHHDAIISSCNLPYSSAPASPRPKAPIVPNTRTKILWETESIHEYQTILGNNLETLRERWAMPSSKSCMSTLLKATSDILSFAAVSTNKSVLLSSTKQSKGQKIPRIVRRSINQLKRKFDSCKQFHSNDPRHTKAAALLKSAKTAHRRLIRNINFNKNYKEDQKMFTLLSSEPSSIFRKIRSLKSASSSQIPFLTVGDTKYEGESVKDGFFFSIKNLKSKPNPEEPKHDLTEPLIDDYKHILDICQNKVDLPPISLDSSTKILKKMKATVNDFYSITPEHFINAGKPGFEHFNFLLNCVIEDTKVATIEELNSCYALLLFKRHGKPKTKDSSYRTISTCPTVSKALDMYIRDLHKDKWSTQEARTQYQGTNSCHELAALLVTEVVQHSLWNLKEPAYLLFLDAKSAFDKVLPELLIRNLFNSGMRGDSINFINNRLTNRLTYLDWAKNIMGPIKDELGLEQGGANSSEYYKLYSNENLKTAQRSQQGIPLSNSVVVSAIGLADDTSLVANKLSKLANILSLTTNYCTKYGVKISHEKTKLLRITKKEHTELEVYNPINIDGHQIAFSEDSEHVGVIRSSVMGNLPHIMNRISAHKKALGATLSSGVAQKSRVNPLVSIRLEKVYGSPVLLSGVASLFLLSSEISLIDRHLKSTYQNIQKLLPKTPSCVVHFLSGCLPGEAVIHIRLLGLFGMVARLTNDPIRIHARNILVAAKSSSKSWFSQIRDLCLKYALPHPLAILQTQPSKVAFKKLVLSKVISYWETKLRGEAALLPSLVNFKPEYMSLKKPHPIWSTTGSNPYEVSKAIQQARFLSGRYRSESLVRHWTKNKEGYCNSVTCTSELENIEHILIHCKAYTECKKGLYSLWLSTTNPVVLKLVLDAFSSETSYLLQFILDCSVLPSVIAATQRHGFGIMKELFHLTRTWCFTIHRQRMKMLGRWNY